MRLLSQNAVPEGAPASCSRVPREGPATSHFLPGAEAESTSAAPVGLDMKLCRGPPGWLWLPPRRSAALEPCGFVSRALFSSPGKRDGR